MSHAVQDVKVHRLITGMPGHMPSVHVRPRPRLVVVTAAAAVVGRGGVSTPRECELGNPGAEGVARRR